MQKTNDNKLYADYTDLSAQLEAANDRINELASEAQGEGKPQMSYAEIRASEAEASREEQLKHYEVERERRQVIFDEMQHRRQSLAHVGDGFAFRWRREVWRWGHWFMTDVRPSMCAFGLFVKAFQSKKWPLTLCAGIFYAARVYLYLQSYKTRISDPTVLANLGRRRPFYLLGLLESVLGFLGVLNARMFCLVFALGTVKTFFPKYTMNPTKHHIYELGAAVLDHDTYEERFVDGDEPRLVGHGLKDVRRIDPLMCTLQYTKYKQNLLSAKPLISVELNPSLEFMVETTCAKVSRPGAIPSDAATSIQTWIQSTHDIMHDRLKLYQGVNIIRDSQAAAFGLYMSEERRTRKVPFTCSPKKASPALFSMATGLAKSLYLLYTHLVKKYPLLCILGLSGLVSLVLYRWDVMSRLQRVLTRTLTTQKQRFLGHLSALHESGQTTTEMCSAASRSSFQSTYERPSYHLLETLIHLLMNGFEPATTPIGESAN
jgi:hypothetical protein